MQQVGSRPHLLQGDNRRHFVKRGLGAYSNFRGFFDSDQSLSRHSTRRCCSRRVSWQSAEANYRLSTPPRFTKWPPGADHSCRPIDIREIYR